MWKCSNANVDNVPSYLQKAVEAARLEAAEKSQATSFSNPMFNQVPIMTIIMINVQKTSFSNLKIIITI